MSDSRQSLGREQAAFRRRAIIATLIFGVIAIGSPTIGVLILTTSTGDTINAVMFICAGPFGAGLVYLGVRLLRRGARTGDYSPPTSGLP